VRIYVASSWRNLRHPIVVDALKGLGHDVYNFREPVPGEAGFGWRQIAAREQVEDPHRFRDEVLAHPRARGAFEHDMGALRKADATVLVLPCGRSAHLELGFATGDGQETLVLLDDPLSEPELMYLMNAKICVNLKEVMDALPQRFTYDCHLCGKRRGFHVLGHTHLFKGDEDVFERRR
jgi:hypothetical protein